MSDARNQNINREYQNILLGVFSQLHDFVRLNLYWEPNFQTKPKAALHNLFKQLYHFLTYIRADAVRLDIKTDMLLSLEKKLASLSEPAYLDDITPDKRQAMLTTLYTIPATIRSAAKHLKPFLKPNFSSCFIRHDVSLNNFLEKNTDQHIIKQWSTLYQIYYLLKYNSYLETAESRQEQEKSPFRPN